MTVSEQVLDNEAWSQVRPLGMRCNLISRERMHGDTFDNVLIHLVHDRVQKECALELVIPVFNGNVIKWRNSKKALMSVGRVLVDSDFEISLGQRSQEERMDLHITSPNETAIRRISEQIAYALRNWFHDIDPEIDNKMVQVAIDKWFSNGEEWRVLKYSPIALENQQDGLVIINDVITKSHAERMVNKIFSPKLWNILDLNSTSFGDKANENFRFVSGVTMQDGKIVKPEVKYPVCDILRKHAIGLGMNPRRAYLLRNTFEQVIDLVKPEEPIVSPYKPGETNMLHGLNLMTAIMHLEHYTHEDGIAISQSAANKMMASRIITQLVESDLPVKALVEVGSPVSSDTVIALDGENHVVSNKLHMPGIVEEVVTSSGKRFGVETNRIWFKMRSFYNLENGDKLSNRHGGKGVVTVIPDELMPWDPDTGEKIEVCIAPESVTNRRSMSVLWEMMLTRKAWDESFRGTRSLSPIHVDLFEVNDGEAQWSQDENHNFAELARKYSFKRNLIYRNQTLPNATFASKLFWMRLDKIAMEIVSSVGKKRTRNNFGAVVDSAKVSGQRCNAAKLLAMSGRGLVNLSLEAIENNMSGQKFFKDLLDSVKNKRYLK